MKKIFNIENIENVCEEILNMIIDNNYRVIFLKGELGAGKTTLAKNICKILGVKDNITSPTFTIMNEYLLGEDSKYYNSIHNIYHIDTYRMENASEIKVLNLDKLINKDNLIFIEWPEILEQIRPDIIIELKIIDENNREISLSN